MIPIYDGLRSYQIADVLGAYDPARAFYYEPQLGKTRTATRCILRWTNELGYTKHLIVGPLTPLAVTWVRELRASGFLPPSEGGGEMGYLVPLLIRKKDKSDWARDVINDLIHGANKHRSVVVLINDDALHREVSGPRGGKKTLNDLLCQWAPHSLIRDEAHRDLNAGSVRAQALRRLARYTKIRRSLTGTPDPNGFINLFSQMAVLAPDLFGTSKKAFMERYCVTAGPHRILYYQNQDELIAKVRSISSIVRAEDFFDLPAKLETDRRYDLPVGARGMYNTLRDTSILEVPDLGLNIDASHHLAKLARLQQLAIGYLPVENPDTAERVAWLHEQTVESVVADLEEPLQAGQKVVVSHRWRPEGERITAALRKAYGARVVVELNGKTKAGDRDMLIAPFDIGAPEMESDVRIIVAQEATGGAGISLARASHLHFASWSFDYAAVDQMMHRTLWAANPTRHRTETFHAAIGTVAIWARALIRRKASATLMVRETGFRAAASGDIPLEAAA